MKNLLTRLSAALLLALSAAQAEPVLAGNPAFAGQTLSGDDIKAVLLGKKVTIGDTRVVLMVAKAGDHQEAFLKQHVGMTTSQFNNHWRRLFMTGGGSAPKVVDTEDAARQLAAETPGAVAVVDAAKAGGLAVLGK
ncbi:MAG TPA: hypothetical protein VEB66_10405 [Opitutaceae bacterium]|nr:hypothetical protein [Opitutaceae bacterium]